MSDLFGGLVLISAGTLYPAYSSYKAVKTKNTREYVKWMMYWIVFAFFNAITLFTDVFISWFPGYYLFKTLFIIWLVSPATRGSTYLYKKVLHPTLRQNEEKIDRAITNIKDRGYDYTSQYARLAMQNFSRSLMEAVFKGQVMIADQMQRQYMQNGEGEIGSSRAIHDQRVRYREFSGNNLAEPAVITEITDDYENEMDFDENLDASHHHTVIHDQQTPEPIISAARQRRRGNKPRGARPVSMPPATIDEVPHPLLDEGSVSDPDYSPEAAPKPERSSRRDSARASEQKRVTRSSARHTDTVEDDDDSDFIE